MVPWLTTKTAVPAGPLRWFTEYFHCVSQTVRRKCLWRWPVIATFWASVRHLQHDQDPAMTQVTSGKQVDLPLEGRSGFRRR